MATREPPNHQVQRGSTRFLCLSVLFLFAMWGGDVVEGVVMSGWLLTKEKSEKQAVEWFTARFSHFLSGKAVAVIIGLTATVLT